MKHLGSALAPSAGKRWGAASFCLLMLALLLFYLVVFGRIFDGPVYQVPGFTKWRFLAEAAWDCLLFIAYIAGRLGDKTVMGIIGAGFGLPLLLVDMLIFMPFAVGELARYSR